MTLKHFDLTFDHVDFSYHAEDTHKILNNLSFQIPEDSFFALIGPSGGGKSTVAQLIFRFWDVFAADEFCWVERIFGTFHCPSYPITSALWHRTMTSSTLPSEKISARAIPKDAPIIILDEATSSVDPETEHLIQEAIRELIKEKTVIAIAHRLPTIEQADPIFVLEHGHIVQSGTHQVLSRQNGTYCEFIKIREYSEQWSLGEGAKL